MQILITTNGEVWVTEDGGGSRMEDQNLGIDVNFTDVHFFDKNNGIVVDQEGTFPGTSNNRGLTSYVHQVNIDRDFSVYPNPSPEIGSIASGIDN